MIYIKSKMGQFPQVRHGGTHLSLSYPEAEAGETQVQGLTRLHSKFKTGLGNLAKPYLKIKILKYEFWI